MSLNRIFKTIFLTEFFSAMLKAIKEIFKPKKLLTTLLKKVILAQDLEENMR